MKNRVTSSDVAKEAGVSQSLVSLILNHVPGKKIKPETREHVLDVANRLGYRANINARNMKGNCARAIGLLSSWEAGSFVFPPVINGIKSICFENDLGLVICSGSKGMEDGYDFMDYYFQNRIDGLVYISYVGVKDDDVIEALSKTGIPFVCIIGARDLPGVSCVDVSFLESGYMAVNHLVDNGYKSIAYLLERRNEDLNYAEKERLEGCIRAAKERNVQIRQFESFIGISGEEGYLKAADELIDCGYIDAVVATSYKCFTVLKAAARRKLSVPEALGVISLDNELYAPYTFPSLTTIDEPLFDIARMATKILLEKISGDGVCKKYEISPVLSVRDSTRKLL